MREKSRTKESLAKLSEIIEIEKIKWHFLTNKVVVHLNKEISENSKKNITDLLLQISQKYEVCFEIEKKKNFWQKLQDFIGKLWTSQSLPPQ